jgi:hypothetical protein
MDRVRTGENGSARYGLNGSPWRAGFRLGLLATVVVFVITTGWFVYQHLRAEATASDAPIVCREAIWDFGELSQEKPEYLHHRFKLENLSGERVRIEKVMPDCGCVVADKPPTEIGPESMVELPVDVNAAGPPGPFQKVVHVILGTTPVSKLTLTIRGTILPSPALYLAPVKLDFGTFSEDETGTRSVKVARYDGSPMRFQRVESQSEALQVKGVVRGDEMDSFIELTMTLNSSALVAGDFRSSIVVVTEDPGYSEIAIPVLGRIAAKSHGLVGSLFVDRLSIGTFQDKPLAAGSGSPPNVEKIDYEGEGAISVQLIVAGDGGSIAVRPVVRVFRRDGTTKPQVCRGTLVVQLVGAKKPVRIPLTVFLSE